MGNAYAKKLNVFTHFAWSKYYSFANICISQVDVHQVLKYWSPLEHKVHILCSKSALNVHGHKIFGIWVLPGPWFLGISQKWPVSLTLVINVSPMSFTPVINNTGILPLCVDTGNQFITGVNDTDVVDTCDKTPETNWACLYLYICQCLKPIIMHISRPNTLQIKQEKIFHKYSYLNHRWTWISSKMFIRIQKAFNPIIRAEGDDDKWKKSAVKNLVSVYL